MKRQLLFEVPQFSPQTNRDTSFTPQVLETSRKIRREMNKAWKEKETE